MATVIVTGIGGTLAAGLLSLASLANAATSSHQSDVIVTSGGELRVTPVFHGSVMLEFGGKVIHVDPWSQGNYTDLPPADLILITHTHADHMDRAMVDKLKKPGMVIVGPPAVIDTLNCAPACGLVEEIGDADRKSVLGIGIEGVAMYNLVNGPAPGKPFHHKGVGSGYILTFGSTRVYLSGDSECTPEIKALTDIAVAFLAMNPPRTSSPAEMALCAAAFKPRIVYPYHYRGSRPEDFAAAIGNTPGMEVRLRKLEGET
jgi:L-ascorbate metabolism protein UlaG (beta-lactamase superfamily)